MHRARSHCGTRPMNRSRACGSRRRAVEGIIGPRRWWRSGRRPRSCTTTRSASFPATSGQGRGVARRQGAGDGLRRSDREAAEPKKRKGKGSMKLTSTRVYVYLRLKSLEAVKSGVSTHSACRAPHLDKLRSAEKDRLLKKIDVLGLGEKVPKPDLAEIPAFGFQGPQGNTHQLAGQSSCEQSARGRDLLRELRPGEGCAQDRVARARSDGRAVEVERVSRPDRGPRATNTAPISRPTIRQRSSST